MENDDIATGQGGVPVTLNVLSYGKIQTILTEIWLVLYSTNQMGSKLLANLGRKIKLYLDFMDRNRHKYFFRTLLSEIL